jgi:hypothetical protein
VPSGRIGKLRGKYLHYPYWSFSQYLEKLDRYTTWAAQELRERGKRARWMSIVMRPAYSFFRHYIFRKGFLDGRMGLIISALASYYVFLKFAKLWAMECGLRPPFAQEVDVLRPRTGIFPGPASHDETPSVNCPDDLGDLEFDSLTPISQVS